jgi:serine/threonine protein kinase
MTLSDDLIDLLKRMLCRNPAERITIDEIKRHRWFPGEQYAIFIQASKAMMHFGDVNSVGEVEEDILSVMTSNGLDCRGLPEALAAGEENELTILYQVYQRQKQAERMNYILRMSNLQTSISRHQKSTPTLRSKPPRARFISYRSQERTGPQAVPNSPRRGDEPEVGPPRKAEVDARPLRKRAPIWGMRRLDSLPKVMEVIEAGT